MGKMDGMYLGLIGTQVCFVEIFNCVGDEAKNESKRVEYYVDGVFKYSSLSDPFLTGGYLLLKLRLIM